MKRCFIAGLLATIVAMLPRAADAAPPKRFEIDATTLADALDRFSEQSGLQVVYDEEARATQRIVRFAGTMRPDDALERMLADSGLHWSYVNERVVLVQRLPANQQALPSAQPGPKRHPVSQDAVATLSLIQVTEDPRRVLPNEASESAFGFSKPILETPRSVSFISDEAIDVFGMSAVEDLAALAPGVFTTTRYGIQGSVDVRNVPADTYFRGMKRLTLQGHGRSVFAAMDTIEVVRGPPSPIDGLGKVGGFTNVVPKSGRARVGGYLEERQGFGQLVLGAYDRMEASFGIGGPIDVFDKHGGYYTYALFEDSDSYTHSVPIRQKVVQTAVSVDEFLGPFRLETGADYQVSGTSGALLNRVTQDVIDHGRYIRGDPLDNLDANGNGHIGYLEFAQGSPVRGNLSAGNQPLMQRWNWPRDANGQPLPLDQLPLKPGIPESLYNYLVTSCGPSPPPTANGCADPTGLLRAQGIGGPLPNSGYVPIGFALDPRTVGYDMLDLRRPGAFEREIEAKFLVGFLDLIYDTDPNFTLKNQLFFDSMDQFKISEQPSGGKQDVRVMADKLTATYRWRQLPSWLRMNTLGSVIVRSTRSSGRRYGGDFSSHRTDVMSADGAMTPNTTFVHSFDNANLYDDGAPWTSHYDTKYWETGVGLLFDIDILERTNFLVGARIDGSEARNTDFAGSFDPAQGTAANPGAFRAQSDTAKAWDTGSSWSISVSHAITPEVRPYATYSSSSLTLDNNNNSMDNAVIRLGHIGSATMREIGVKASLFEQKLFVSSALYDQWRSDASASDPSVLLSTDITTTRTRGWETEVKWVPSKDLLVSLYALAQETTFLFSAGANILVDARALGFRDVVDGSGNVIYPAEAFLYGGRAFLTLPSGVGAYEEKQGNPNIQVGLNTTYQLTNGLGFTLSSSYVSSVHSGRLKLVELPEAYVVDAGIFLQLEDWRVKLDVGNVLNERYFRARTGDTLGDTHVQAMPERHWQMAVRYVF
jgi:iron complex outermembrane receptor protein